MTVAITLIEGATNVSVVILALDGEPQNVSVRIDFPSATIASTASVKLKCGSQTAQVEVANTNSRLFKHLAVGPGFAHQLPMRTRLKVDSFVTRSAAFLMALTRIINSFRAESH